jgi:hypothetical protein
MGRWRIRRGHNWTNIYDLREEIGRTNAYDFFDTSTFPSLDFDTTGIVTIDSEGFAGTIPKHVQKVKPLNQCVKYFYLRFEEWSP